MAAASEPSGQVVLGIPPSPRTLLAVSIISAFCETYPHVTVRIRENTSGELRDLVVKGEVDLAIINPEEPLHNLISIPLVSEPMLLVGPANANLSLDISKPNSSRRMVEFELNTRGIRPRLRVEANTLPLITDLVTQGLGFTALPSCGVYPLVESRHLSVSPLVGLQITWIVARPIDRSLSVAARLLQDTIRRVVHNIVESGGWPLANGSKQTIPKALPTDQVSIDVKAELVSCHYHKSKNT